MLVGSGCFGCVCVCLFVLKEQLKDAYRRAPGFIIKITKLQSSKINHKLSKSSTSCGSGGAFQTGSFSLMYLVFFCLFCMS